MNANSFIFGTVVGAGIGSALTYFFVKKNCDKKIDEEVRKVREYYERYEDEEEEAKRVHVKKIPDKPIPDEILEKYRSNETLSDPSENEFPTEDDEDELDDLDEENAVVDNEIIKKLEKENDKPKIIEVESFGELSMFETETLSYYVEDGFLVHEDDEIVDDVEFLIGDALDRYGWRYDDLDDTNLYVRNYKLQRDYEIIKVIAEFGRI